MRFAIDMTGQRYGRLTIIARNGATSKGAKWMCRCDCGNLTTVTRSNLLAGNVQSCGCYRQETNHNQITNLKHGHASTRTSTYRSWEAMRQRCNNSNCDWYHRYGGRGISVCERWNDYITFLQDMGVRPNGKTLDRINPNDNYHKDNCRWATPKEQANNRERKDVSC